MKTFRPMFFSTIKNYSKEKFLKDITAGIIVAIIALPLSIALALASGVGPEEGLYTAILAGFIISFLGGSTVQIAGPTAAFATIVAGIVAANGLQGLAAATVMAGILLVIMGFCGFGSLIRFIPNTITTGFTAGIAVTIAIGQIKDFCCLTYPAGTAAIETMDKLKAIAANIHTVNPWAVAVGSFCLAVQLIWPRINKKIPSAIMGVIAGILLVKVFQLPVSTIGDLYTVRSGLPVFRMPELSGGMILKLLPNAVTIAVLAAIESLLSCVVADQMTNTTHRSNTELIAQGLGNIGSALFGGIPATGAIARTAANIKNGGSTPVAGMVHAVTLVLILLVFMPCVAWIPMPAIASILFIVAYNMCQWRPFVKICRTESKLNVFILIITFVLTVVFNLVAAIAVGLIIALPGIIKERVIKVF